MAKLDPTDRFLRLVAFNESNGCIEWQGALSRHSKHQGRGGYPQFRVGDKIVYAHRWALAQVLGRDLLPGHEADHICCNRRCVNPAHLQEVSSFLNKSLITQRRLAR